MATTYRIHPALGIARVGNSREIFIGPEEVDSVQQKYKVGVGKIRRQAARFSVFEVDTTTGKTVREVQHDGDSVRIVWAVHLANRKAAHESRNRDVADRTRLVIDAGEERISGGSVGPYELAGSFQGRGARPQRVVLGDLRTDEQGRLIVAGGYGKSFTPTGAPVTSYKNNDDWCDDTSDGPVRAFLQLDGGGWIETESAWVVVAPTDFAPPVRDGLSLYDLMDHIAFNKFKVDYDPALAPGGTMSFRNHLYPLLKAVALAGWVEQGQKVTNYLDPDVFAKLKSNLPEHMEDRKKVYKEITGKAMDPDAFEAAIARLDQENLTAKSVPPDLAAAIPLTDRQTALLERWKNGDFAADFDNPLPQEPWLVRDKAALTLCVGNKFIPGIEVSGIVREKGTYRAPFRLDPQSPAIAGRPGSLTAGLAVPWQADFQLCGIWPSQRPVGVKRGGQSGQSWNQGVHGYEDMTEKWKWMGFVLAEEHGTPPEHVEKGRDLC